MSFTEFITDINTLNVDNIVFSPPKETQGFKRIYINIKEGSDKSPLYIAMGSRFCFGVQASTGMQSGGEIIGYQMPLAMYDQGMPTEEQVKFLDAFEKIANKCAKHLVQPEVKKALKKFSLSEAQFVDKFTPMWYKRDENGERDTSKGPILYAKLLTERDDKEPIISTQFADSRGYPIEPMTLIDKMFRVEGCLLQIHSIFIGTTIKLQVKVVEVEVEPRQKRKAPLMLKRKPQTPIEPEELDDVEKFKEEPIQEPIEEEKIETDIVNEEIPEITSTKLPVFEEKPAIPAQEEMKRGARRRLL